MIPEVEKLEELRKKLGYSQHDVASLMDSSLPSYQNWVYKEHVPNYKNLKKINKAIDKLEERLREKFPTEEELGLKKTKESDKYAVYES